MTDLPEGISLSRLGYFLCVFHFLLKGVIFSDLVPRGFRPVVLKSDIGFVWLRFLPFPLFRVFSRFLKA